MLLLPRCRSTLNAVSIQGRRPVNPPEWIVTCLLGHIKSLTSLPQVPSNWPAPPPYSTLTPKVHFAGSKKMWGGGGISLFERRRQEIEIWWFGGGSVWEQIAARPFTHSTKATVYVCIDLGSSLYIQLYSLYSAVEGVPNRFAVWGTRQCAISHHSLLSFPSQLLRLFLIFLFPFSYCLRSASPFD